MVYNETLIKYDKIVKDSIKELVDLADKNQKNENDILLVYLNGWKNLEYEEAFRKSNLSPFIIGPGLLGHCVSSFYEFYDDYRSNIIHKSAITDETRKTQEFLKKEQLIVDIELLIYLKFWEADLILFKLFNLVQLATAQDYNWDLQSGFLGSRRNVIKIEIQKAIETLCPQLYSLIEETYSTQIRNAIAHSKYFLSNRMIHFANKRESKHYKISNIDFDNWEIMFHKIILLYNHLLLQLDLINQKYIEKAKDKFYGLSIRIPEKGKLNLDKVFWIKYDDSRKDWNWYRGK